MNYINRLLESQIKHALKRGKSVLLLGARQTGKTTLIQEQIKPDISYSFSNIEIRQRYEKDPISFARELEAQLTFAKSVPKPEEFKNSGAWHRNF